jgi:hypothetical protein
MLPLCRAKFGVNINQTGGSRYTNTLEMVIPYHHFGVSMAANDAMSTIKLRRYDLDRIKEIRLPREANWEVVKRLLDEYIAERI